MTEFEPSVIECVEFDEERYLWPEWEPDEIAINLNGHGPTETTDADDRRAVDAERFRQRIEEDAQRELRKLLARKRAHELARELHVETGGWVDVAAIVDAGVQPPEPPSVLRFADDPTHGLLYAGRYNALFGDGGIGKSWLMAAIQAEHVNAGRHVVHLEFDNNTPPQVVWRLIAAGAKPELVREFLHVLVNEVAVPDFDFEPAFASLDSVNAAIALYDVDANSSSKGVDTMIHQLIEPFTGRGATALSLDHVGHSDQDRPSNNRRKLQAVQGIMLRIEREGDAGRVGTKWVSRLTVTKDNPGWCPVAVGETLGFAVYDGTAGDGMCDVSLWRTPVAELAAAHAADNGGQRRRDEVLQILREAQPEALRTSEVVKRYNEGKPTDAHLEARAINRVLKELESRQVVTSEQRGKGERAPLYWAAVK